MYKHFLSHDANLVWVEPGADKNGLQDLMNPLGLRAPVPSGFTFFGGDKSFARRRKRVLRR